MDGTQAEHLAPAGMEVITFTEDDGASIPGTAAETATGATSTADQQQQVQLIIVKKLQVEAQDEDDEELKPTFHCQNCGESFSSSIKLSQHITKKHFKFTDEEYTCNICQEVVHNKRFCVSHFKSAHTDQPTKKKVYKCTDCGMQFDNNYALCGHRKAHSDNLQRKGKYECKLCFAKLMVSSSLKRHYKICHGIMYESGVDLKGPYPCINCSNVFQECDELRAHIKSCGVQGVNSSQRFICELCNKAFAKKWQLEKHKRSHTDSDWKFHCEDCQLGFLREEDVQLHLRRRECRGNQHACEICKKNFQTCQNLKRHMREIHKVGVSEIEGQQPAGRPYQCPVCDKTFVQKGHLNRHMALHSDNPRPHKCAICNKSFAEMHQLKRHMLIHTGHHPEKCMDCDMSFRTVYELNQHRQMHISTAEAKKFECDYCGRIFPLKSRLVAHLRVHTNEKPYKCAICPMAFRYYHGLYKHKLTHITTPGLKCEKCSKVFKDKIGLAGHWKHVHATLKRMACEKCGKCFIRLSDLHNHRQLVSRQHPYKCPYCCCAYLSKKTLMKHKKILHGKVKPHVCPTCKERFKERKEMIAHIQDSHLVKEKFNMYLCDFPNCSKSFMTQHHLERHICNHKSSGKGQTGTVPARSQNKRKRTSRPKRVVRKRAKNGKDVTTTPIVAVKSEPVETEEEIPALEYNHSVRVINIRRPTGTAAQQDEEEESFQGMPKLLSVSEIKQEPAYGTDIEDEEGTDAGTSGSVVYNTIGSVTLINPLGITPTKKKTEVSCATCGVEFSNNKLLDIHQMVHSAD